MVEKRIGVGFTFNMATSMGKYLMYGILGFAGTIIIGTMILLLLMDFTTYSVQFTDTAVEIKAPLYNYSLNYAEVEGINTIDSLPKGTKVNGAGTKRYSIGIYRLEGYGNCHVYINKGNSPYIVIKLKDTYVILNGKSEEQTKEYYETISSHISNK